MLSRSHACSESRSFLPFLQPTESVASRTVDLAVLEHGLSRAIDRQSHRLIYQNCLTYDVCHPDSCALAWPLLSILRHVIKVGASERYVRRDCVC